MRSEIVFPALTQCLLKVVAAIPAPPALESASAHLDLVPVLAAFNSLLLEELNPLQGLRPLIEIHRPNQWADAILVG